MDQSDGEVKARYVKSASGTDQQRSYVHSFARHSSLRCVNGDNVVIVSDDDADDVSDQLGSWTCTVCTTLNPVSVAECISCLTLQTPVTSLTEDETNGAEQFSGTEDGKDESEVRAMDVDTDDEVWVCRRCTFQNITKSTRCEVCEAPRRSTSFRNQALGSAADKRQQSADADSKVNVGGKGDNEMQILGSGKSDSATMDSVVKGGMQKNADQARRAAWTCSSCTYNNNPSWANICDVCESVKQVYNSPEKQSGIGKVAAGIGKAVSKMTDGWLKEKVATSWLCANCSTVNANKVRDCTCCGALRATAESAQDTWTCTKCTLRNNNLAHVCAACLSKRNTVLPQVDGANTIWPCPKCTCVNHSDQHVCQACEYDKQASHNYNSNHQVPDESTSNSTRQRSVFVKEKRIEEEMAAHDQWIQIVNFCKVVSYLCLHILFM